MLAEAECFYNAITHANILINGVMLTVGRQWGLCAADKHQSR